MSRSLGFALGGAMTYGRSCPVNLWRVAARKLDQLDSVVALDELNVPPGNRLEALVSDREGQHSIRIKEKSMVRIPTHRSPIDLTIA